MSDIKKWLNVQEKENDDRLKQKLAEQGRSPYLLLDIGENTITLLPEIPSSRESSFGKDQAVFKVEKDKEVFDWSVTKTSPMFIQIARKLAKSPIDITIIRTGRGQATRLDLKEV